MHNYEVGKPFIEGKTSWPEVVFYNYANGGHALTIFLPTPSATEIENIRVGKVQFAVTVRDGIIFLLSKFGDAPWMDAPYQWWINSPSERTLPPMEVGAIEGALIQIVLVDGSTGIIKVLRAIGMAHETTLTLHTAIRKQSRTAWLGRADYEKRLAKINRRFTTEDLLANALRHEALALDADGSAGGDTSGVIGAAGAEKPGGESSPPLNTPYTELLFAINHYVSTGDHLGQGVILSEGENLITPILYRADDPMDAEDARRFRLRVKEMKAQGWNIVIEDEPKFGEFQSFTLRFAERDLLSIAQELLRSCGAAGWGSGKALIDAHPWLAEDVARILSRK